MFNRGGNAARITLKWVEVGVTTASPRVRDLWADKNISADAEFAEDLPARGVVLLQVP